MLMLMLLPLLALLLCWVAKMDEDCICGGFPCHPAVCSWLGCDRPWRPTRNGCGSVQCTAAAVAARSMLLRCHCCWRARASADMSVQPPGPSAVSACALPHVMLLSNVQLRVFGAAPHQWSAVGGALVSSLQLAGATTSPSCPCCDVYHDVVYDFQLRVAPRWLRWSRTCTCGCMRRSTSMLTDLRSIATLYRGALSFKGVESA
jgi:hypothetical protein